MSHIKLFEKIQKSIHMIELAVLKVREHDLIDAKLSNIGDSLSICTTYIIIWYRITWIY
jgi:hypothetical protein